MHRRKQLLKKGKRIDHSCSHISEIHLRLTRFGMLGNSAVELLRVSRMSGVEFGTSLIWIEVFVAVEEGLRIFWSILVYAI